MCASVCTLPAVGGGAPAAVRVSGEPPPEHELLVLLHEGAVSEDHADVVGVEALGALGAADVDAALRDLDAQVLPETVGAGAVVTRHDVREAVSGVAQQAQRTFQELGRRGGRRGCGRYFLLLLRLLHFRLNDALDASDAVHAAGQRSRLARLRVQAASSEKRPERDAPLFRRLSGGGGKLPLRVRGLVMIQAHLSVRNSGTGKR